MRLTTLSRSASHALRHEPWLYGLELNDNGWTSIDELARALGTDASTIRAMAAASDKQRFEIDDARIRAAYGHSLPERIAYPPAQPPALLFHGTDPAVLVGILDEGLVPRARQYVHLSVDARMALAVGRRKAAEPVLLEIVAGDAAASGVAFYMGNERVWLADRVPPQFIRRP